MAANLTTRDGVALHLRHWPSTRPNARGTVLLVHGIGEHVGRYADLARNLNAAGFHVTGHDQRGHGRSEGRKGFIPQAESLLDDLSVVVDHVRGTAPGPLVLLGHSMGGLVAARFVAEALQPSPARWSRPVDRLVLSSPAIDAGLGLPQRLQLALGQALAPGLAVGNGLKTAWLSRDPAVVAAYEADPLVHDRVTPRLAGFIVAGGEAVLRAAPRWQVPTLLMWAGADRCVAPAGSEAFAEAVPEGVLQAERWPALFHEIFNEPERGHVVARLTRWLDETLPEETTRS